LQRPNLILTCPKGLFGLCGGPWKNKNARRLHPAYDADNNLI
jgi:hypothetical protein